METTPAPPSVQLKERTIEELLMLATEDLLKIDQATIESILKKAILDQEEILKKVPKKKGPTSVDLTSGGGVSRKEAVKIRNNNIALPPEFAQMAAEFAALKNEAEKLMKPK